MGADIHINVLIKTKNGWEDAVLYKKNKHNVFLPVDVYSYRNYKLFDILNKNTDINFPATYINSQELPEDLRKEIEKERKEFYYGFYETNLADLKLYYLDNPFVEDYDNSKDETVLKDNPIKDFIDIIYNYAEAWLEGFDVLYSNIKIVYRFDR